MPRFTIEPRRPYSLGLTVARFARFPEVVDRVEEGVYRRLVFAGGAPLLIEVSQRESAARARLRVRLSGSAAGSRAARGAAERIVHGALGAGVDVRPFYRAQREDPVLGPAIRASRGLRAAGWPSLFEALVSAVLSQQINLRFAYSIRRELALALGRRARIEGRSYVAFPTPRRVARETPASLRSFRLSEAKARAIHGIARAFASGALVDAELEALPDDAVVERLMTLRGVGRWTAEIALIRGLYREDAFPAADLGVVKYLAQGLLGHKGVAREAEMRRYAERWRPYRALALVYAYAELERRRGLGS